MSNETRLEELEARIAKLETMLTYQGMPWIRGQLRITQEDGRPGLHLDQSGSSTAMVVHQSTPNPAVKIISQTEACLELVQWDKQDSISAPDSDGRFSQVIAARHCVKGGSLQFTEDTDAKDVEYYDAMRLSRGDLFLGNADRNWGIRLVLGTEPFTIETGDGTVLLRVSEQGTYIRQLRSFP